jgi:hypothetical protein
LVLFASNGKGRSNSVALTASTLPLLNKGKWDSLEHDRPVKTWDRRCPNARKG